MGRIVVGGARLAWAVALVTVFGFDQARAQSNSGRYSRAHVYVMTGLVGLTSRLDGAVQKVRGRGVPLTVTYPAAWSSLAASAIESYRGGRLRSIIIVGYSAGGGAAFSMASALDRENVPVQLMVTVEPVWTSAIPSNVHSLINFYVPGGISGAIPRPANFRGSLKNIADDTRGVGHWTIAFAREDDVVNSVLAAARRTGASKPAPKENMVQR